MVTRGSKADSEGMATTNRLPSEPGHEPPSLILSQPPLPGQGRGRSGHHQGPLLRGATLPLHDLPQDLRRHHGHPFYRLHKDPALFVCVVTLLAYGCPTQAIVAAFGLDERSVAAWQNKAGGHVRAVHRYFLGTLPL